PILKRQTLTRCFLRRMASGGARRAPRGMTRVLVDMSLSPEWVDRLTNAAWRSVHWSKVGDPRASDTALMEWARANQHIVFTNDLDFGSVLALTHASGSPLPESPSTLRDPERHDVAPEWRKPEWRRIRA